MIELLGGIVIGGVAGVVAKDKIMGTASLIEAKQREIDSLCNENNKYARRNKELERQVEDLLSELDKAKKKAKSNNDSFEDLEDELDRARRELKNVRLQNDELVRTVKELKSACESQKAEIELLKEKQG